MPCKNACLAAELNSDCPYDRFVSLFRQKVYNFGARLHRLTAPLRLVLAGKPSVLLFESSVKIHSVEAGMIPGLEFKDVDFLLNGSKRYLHFGGVTEAHTAAGLVGVNWRNE